MKAAKYRVENGSVYEYSEGRRAYIFCGKLNGRTLKQFVKEIEQSDYYMNQL